MIFDLFKPKHKVGDTVFYVGYLSDLSGILMPFNYYELTIEKISGNWFFGYWYVVNYCILND